MEKEKEKEKEPATAEGCFGAIVVAIFLVIFCLAEGKWIVEQWKTWGCLIKVCLSPLAVAVIASIIAPLFKTPRP